MTKLIVFLYFLVINTAISDTLTIKKDALILQEIVSHKMTINKIVELNYLLDGYLIFQFLEDSSQNMPQYIRCRIYFVDSLNHFGGEGKFYLYTGNDVFMQSGFYDGKNDSIYNSMKTVWKCYRAFNKDKSSECKPFYFNNEDGLKANVFDKAVLLERDGISFIIAKIKIYAWIYEYFSNVDTTMKKVFVPNTKLLEFIITNEMMFEKFNFKKSTTVLKFID